MVRPIDEKIVAMKMDNSDLKQKAAETTGIFGKIRDSLSKIPNLDLSRTTKAFSDVQSAANGVNMNNLANNVDTIAGKFTNLGIVATTALVNISNRAVDAGLNLAKSMVIDPVMDGFREYETKIKSIGTMLSNTEWAGTTLDDVKKTLGELNDYADKTIYSFEQMTENIGRFTAAGVTLEDSAIAIKGLGNLAAASGSDVNQLNTAMYQSSQALASGKLNLEDWNSLVNAGMAGKKTQDALVETARLMGKNVDLTDGFRNSIQDGWLTSEVFLATLKKFGEDESMTKAATSVRTFTGMIAALKEGIGSGWATTWELMFGDFEEATRRWTGLSEVIGGFFAIFDDARNKMVKGMADAGIFRNIFDIFVNSGKLVISIFEAIGSGITRAFSGSNLGLMDSIGKALGKLANAIKPNDKALKNLSVTFEALFSVVALVVKIFDGLGKILLTAIIIPLKLISAVILGVSKGILAVTGYISRLVVAFADGVKTGKDMSESLGGLKGIFSTIGAAIGKALQKISAFGDAIKDAWKVLKTGDISKIGPWAEDAKIIDKLLKIREAVVGFKDGIKEAYSILTTGNISDNGPWAEDTKIVKGLLNIREGVLDFGNAITEAWNILSKGKFTGVGPWAEDSVIVEKLFAIRQSALDFASGVVEAWNIIINGNYTGKGPWAKDSEMVERLFKIRESAFDVANGVVEAWSILANGDYLGVGPWAEDSKVVKSLFTIREAVLDFGNGLVEAWSILTKGDYLGVGPWSEESAIVQSLFNIREALKDFGLYLLNLPTDFSLDPIVKGFEKLSGFISGAFTGDSFANWLSKIGDGINNVTSYLGSLNISIDPILEGFKNFFQSIGDGFTSFFDMIKGIGDKIKEAFAGIEGNDILAGGFIAGMVAVLGMAVKLAWDLWDVFTGWGKIGTGISDTLESVSGALNAFTTSIYANALITIAIAVGILAVSLMVLSRLDGQQIGTSLYGVIGILSALIGSMAIMAKYNITGTGMQSAMTMVGMAAAVLVMAAALKKIAEMDTAELTKGIVGLVGIMGTLAGAITLMSRFGSGNVAASALQMVALATSIHILISAIKKIANIDTGDLVKGVTTLGIVMVQLGIFMAMSKGSTFGPGSAVGILAIAGSIHIIVAAIKQIAEIDTGELKTGLVTIGAILVAVAAFSQLTSGAGLLATGAGLVLLATALNLLLVPIVTMGSMDIKTLAKGLGAMAVALLAIGAASMLMQGLLASGAGLILMATGLTMLLGPIAAFSAMSWEGILKGIVGMAGALLAVGGAALLLSPAIPSMLGFGAALTLIGVGALAAGAGIALLATGLVTLGTMSAATITTIVATFGTLIAGFVSLIPIAVSFIWDIIQKMADAFVKHAPKLATTMYEGLIKMLNVVADNIPKFADAATKLITNFLDALSTNIPKIVKSATDLMVNLVDALADAVETNGPRFLEAWMRLMAETISLMIEAGVAVIQALFGWIPGVTDATNKIGETAEQTIREAFDAKGAGEDKGKDFAGGVNSKTGDAQNAGTNISNSAKSGASSADVGSIGSVKGLDFASALGATSGNAQSSGISIATAGKTGAGSIDMTTTGSNFGQGFANGISNAWDSVVTSARNLAQAAKNAVENWLDMHSPSREMIKDGEFFGEGFAIGIASTTEDVSKEAENMAKEAEKAARDSFKGELETAEYNYKMGITDSDQFIATLEDIKSRYTEYGDLVQDVDLKILKTKQAVAKAEDKAWQAEVKADKKLIEVKKYYNELSLAQELEAWETLVAKYEDGTQEKIDAEKEVYRVKNEINNRLKEVNEDYAKNVESTNKRLIDAEMDLTNKYNQSVKDRAKAISGFTSIFEEVDLISDVTGNDLMANLQDQIYVIKTWTENLKQLDLKGLDEALLAELTEMGPRAAKEIAALNMLTESQLAEYSSLWNYKNLLATNQAKAELVGLKEETISQIEQLHADALVELEGYETDWLKKISEIREGTADQFVGLDTTMEQIGNDTIEGLKKGLLEKEGPLMEEAKRIADAIAATIRSALQINSPSKVTTILGAYTGEGLAVGLASKVKDVAKSAKDLALTAKDSLNQFLEGFELPEEDSELHFKAVIDYEAIDPNKFGRIRPMSVVPDTSLTTGLASATRATMRQNGNNTPTTEVRKPETEAKSTVITQTLNFHSKEMTPSEVARKNLQASRQLAMQWGV